MKRPLRIAVSASIFHRDASRATYNGRPLSYVEQSMTDWLYEHGAQPYVIGAPSFDRLPLDAVDYGAALSGMDGLLLQGGVDVSPTSYGQQPLRPEWAGDRRRDEYELALLEAAITSNKPVLGICRGCQLINVALGGTLYQDIATQVPASIQHNDREVYELNRHEVEFPAGSELAALYNVTRGVVNSVHHQAIDRLAEGLVVLARSVDDDLVEAVKLAADPHDEPWVLGVQWHPEFQDPRDETLLPTAPLLRAFFRAIEARTHRPEGG